MLQKLVLAIVFSTALSACSSVTIHPKPTSYIWSEPTYEESKDFYLFGLSGLTTVDVKQICGDREVIQMQSVRTFRDGFLTFLSLGIYSPHTVRVWCE